MSKPEPKGSVLPFFGPRRKSRRLSGCHLNVALAHLMPQGKSGEFVPVKGELSSVRSEETASSPLPASAHSQRHDASTEFVIVVHINLTVSVLHNSIPGDVKEHVVVNLSVAHIFKSVQVLRQPFCEELIELPAAAITRIGRRLVEHPEVVIPDWILIERQDGVGGDTDARLVGTLRTEEASLEEESVASLSSHEGMLSILNPCEIPEHHVIANSETRRVFHQNARLRC